MNPMSLTAVELSVVLVHSEVVVEHQGGLVVGKVVAGLPEPTTD